MSTHVFKITLCYDKKMGNKVMSLIVNICHRLLCHRLLKLGMSNHVFKISLCYDKKWDIKLCISVNVYCRLLKLGMSTHFFKLAYAMMKNGRKGYVSQLISILDFQNLV